MTQADLFSQIRALVPTLDGWCTVERAILLAQLVIEEKPDTSVVLGTYGGRDTFALALAHRWVGRGKCFSVDPFSASASVAGQFNVDEAWWNNQPMHDLVLQRFLANMNALGLEPWINFKRKTAAEAVPPKKIGCLVIDANHGPDSIADVLKWAPHVPRMGYCHMDDLQWTGGNVVKAVERLLKLGFEKIQNQDTGALFRRTSVPAAKRRAKR